MKPHPLLLIKPIITFLFLIISFPTSYSEDDEQYTICSTPFSCGKFPILYPFWKDGRPAYCGNDERFKLRGCEDGQLPIINIGGEDFHVIDLNQFDYVMKIARLDYWDNVCPTQYKNTTLDERFSATEVDYIRLFYDCNDDLEELTRAYQLRCNQEQISFYASDMLLRELTIENPECSQRVDIPVPVNGIKSLPNGVSELLGVLKQGFNVSYTYEFYRECMQCTRTGGICGNNTSTSKFTCYCRDGVCPINTDRGPNWILKIIIGMGTPLGMIGICCFTIYYFKKGKKSGNNQDFEAFLKNHGPLAVQRYNYSQVKKMTNSFKEKLGKGGYGIVYKGKLSNDRLVAVKVLNSSKGEGEEFINEVASISRTSHVNIVALLGFCLEVDKRVLIYEFMPNGSLDKYIGNASTLNAQNNNNLEWKTMHQIAIGIARGLDYLHQRCNTRIVHFDIKPQNILLDENFSPKISDFGLAKLCVRKESIISMLDTRGTVGYIAPEVFSRNFGKVSYKSDIYSYGMMVLEMIGGKTKDENETDTTSETYFPNWIYKRLEVEKTSELHGEIVSIEEGEIVRKMTIIGLWCIQTNPSDRPSMSSVLEMLQGSIDALTIPPKPFLSSLPKSPPICSFDSSITLTIE